MNSTDIIEFEKKTYGSTPSYVFDKFWYFVAERQNIFFNRLNNLPQPWTKDEILFTYKFTNVYRATDRVSQFLIKNVIYSSENYSEEDLLFRILFFKIFNKIETWIDIEKQIGDINYSSYNFYDYDSILSDLITRQKIYSAAYIMPSGVSAFGYKEKHRNNLKLLENIFSENTLEKIMVSKNMEQVYNLLLSFPTIGPFLAFQYSIDINYSEITNFDEMSFVKAGPGALRGIKKCFPDSSKSPEEIIKLIAQNQEIEFQLRNINFRKSGNRKMQLIDCQNVFCEFDKYTRVSNPEFSIGNNRIKQKFSENSEKIDFFFPPKWNIQL